MTRTIKIISVEDTGSTTGCGSQASKPAGQSFAAGIDTDIFEADTQELEGERFWEAFWQTQHTYGGVAEGQSLAQVFKSLDDAIFGKLYQDAQRVASDASALPDEEANDILGMVNFLLCIERGDPHYDPFGADGYAAVMARFVAAAEAEQKRRAG